MLRSFETRLDLRSPVGIEADNTLKAYSALMSKAERKILAKLLSGRFWTGDLHKSMYRPLGITATHLDMAYRQLSARLSCAREVGKWRERELRLKIKSKTVDIRRKTQQLDRTKKLLGNLKQELAAVREKLRSLRELIPSIAAGPLRIRTLKALLDRYYAKREAWQRAQTRKLKMKEALHWHKRRLGHLTHQIEKCRLQQERPALCFGSRKLFRRQFASSVIRHGQSHEAWLAAWRAKRNNALTFEGDKSRQGGNPFARLSENANGTFNLELRLPMALARNATKSYQVRGREINAVDFHDLSFNHGRDVIKAALRARRPITIRLIRDDRSWRIVVTVRDDLPIADTRIGDGALGLDLNARHLAAAVVDANGNPIRIMTVLCSTRAKSANQSTDILCKAALKMVRTAQIAGLPIVAELLDFTQKKALLEKWRGPKYSRDLSRFSYGKFNAALISACARNGVGLIKVRSYHSTRVGQSSFARRYGLTSHEAAAVVIARRAVLHPARNVILSRDDCAPGKSYPCHPTATREERKACMEGLDPQAREMKVNGAISARFVETANLDPPLNRFHGGRTG